MQTVMQTLYIPSDGEEYMNFRQIAYFQEILVNWRDQLIAGTRGFISDLQDSEHRRPDVIDLGSMQAEKERSFGARRQQSRILDQIDRALEKIDNGTYGYCEATGEKIGLARLMVMPFAVLSVEAQEQLERSMKKFH